MTIFDNREQAFENKYSQELDKQFKANMLRNRFMGMWLAEKMGLIGKEIDSYVHAVVESDLQKPGAEDVIAKIMIDIEKNKLNISEDQVRRKMDYYLEKAHEELKKK